MNVYPRTMGVHAICLEMTCIDCTGCIGLTNIIITLIVNNNTI